MIILLSWDDVLLILEPAPPVHKLLFSDLTNSVTFTRATGNSEI